MPPAVEWAPGVGLGAVGLGAVEGPQSPSRGMPLPRPGLWWPCLLGLVPEEMAELLHHKLSCQGTLPGMAAFKRLINIQIDSSHFNLNSMHIIR